MWACYLTVELAALMAALGARRAMQVVALASRMVHRWRQEEAASMVHWVVAEDSRPWAARPWDGWVAARRLAARPKRRPTWVNQIDAQALPFHVARYVIYSTLDERTPPA